MAVQAGKYQRITDIPLDNPENIEALLKAWYYLQEAKDEHAGARIMVLELERRYYSTELNDNHRSALRWNLIEDRTQQDAGRIMGASTRWVARLVSQGLHRMSEMEKTSLAAPALAGSVS